MNKVLEFFKSAKKALIVLGCLLFTTFLCVGLGHGIESDWGHVTVTSGSITANTELDESGESYQMGYKLYIPEGVDEAHPAPAVLCLHGYQNDHETRAAYAIEFARHGYVALAIDEFGHGSTNVGMLYRGVANHTLKVCYGWDSDEAGTYKGVERLTLLKTYEP